MKLFNKIREKSFFINKDFNPIVKKGEINNVRSVIFYSVNGIGDLIIASSLIKHFICTSSEFIYLIRNDKNEPYVNVLKEEYPDKIHVIDYGRNIFEACSYLRNIDVVVDVLGGVCNELIKIASMLRPKAVLTLRKTRRSRGKLEMLHESSDMSSLMCESGVLLADVWGAVTQNIGGKYDRKMLFPVQKISVKDEFIALSITGSTRGCLTYENIIKICSAIRKNFKVNICLLSSPSVSEICNNVSENFEDVFVPKGSPSLKKSAQYIEKAKLLISVCSAPVHVAGAFNTPVMVLRNVVQKEWRPTVDVWDEFITGRENINCIDIDSFEKILLRIMNTVNAIQLRR